MRVPKISELLADQLRQRILSGELRDGDALPPEKALIEQSGASRPSLREALRILEVEGLLTVSRGSAGAIVHRPDISVAARHMSFILRANAVSLEDVHRTRVLIEPSAARLVAAKGGKAAAERLRVCQEAIRTATGPKEYGEAEERFHRELVELAGVRTLAYLMDLIHSVLETYLATVAVSAADRTDTMPTRVKSLKSKDRLIALIAAGDAEGAEDFWRKHLEVTHKVLQNWQPISSVTELGTLRR